MSCGTRPPCAVCVAISFSCGAWHTAHTQTIGARNQATTRHPTQVHSKFRFNKVFSFTPRPPISLYSSLYSPYSTMPADCPGSLRAPRLLRASARNRRHPRGRLVSGGAGGVGSRSHSALCELELVQSHMAQKPVLRGEVGCACVAREVSVERGGTVHSASCLTPFIDRTRVSCVRGLALIPVSLKRIGDTCTAPCMHFPLKRRIKPASWLRERRHGASVGKGTSGKRTAAPRPHSAARHRSPARPNSVQLQ